MICGRSQKNTVSVYNGCAGGQKPIKYLAKPNKYPKPKKYRIYPASTLCEAKLIPMGLGIYLASPVFFWLRRGSQKSTKRS